MTALLKKPEPSIPSEVEGPVERSRDAHHLGNYKTLKAGAPPPRPSISSVIAHTSASARSGDRPGPT
ncbi:hypothetical protein GCM10011404_30260 [Sphingomonas prati]|nr:hypothetical protein GCM10011404_30260 [Sphingomonas prati]